MSSNFGITGETREAKLQENSEPRSAYKEQLLLLAGYKKGRGLSAGGRKKKKHLNCNVATSPLLPSRSATFIFATTIPAVADLEAANLAILTSSVEILPLPSARSKRLH